MKAYIDGVLSTAQETFIPEDLWFATNDCEDNTIVSKDCLCLSGLTCESSVENKEFSCRWKGVEIRYINSNNQEIETEDFTVEEFLQMIQDKNMRLVNMSAFFDTNVDVTITQFTLVENEKEYIVDCNLIDTIEFLS